MADADTPSAPAKTPQELFREGWNCAQAVFLAHAAEWGIPDETARRIAAPFGGGLSGLRRTCGTLSALAMLRGLAAGDYPPGDVRAKNAFYRTVRDLEAEYVRHFGTSICLDLLKHATGRTPSADSSPRTPSSYAARTPCESCLLLAEDLFRRTLAPLAPPDNAPPV